MPRKKRNAVSMYCPVCEKWRDSHNYFKGVIIHERDDCPPDTLYFINEDTFDLANKNKKSPTRD